MAATSAATQESVMVPVDPIEQGLQEILGEVESDAEVLACLVASGGRSEHDEMAIKSIREQAVLEMA